MKYSLTEGPIVRSMVAFAVPMLIGNLFQQFYSLVDAAIVGRFLGKTALAAVSICVSPNYLMTDLITGLSVGAGIVIANSFGAKDGEKLYKAVHTTVALSIIVGIATTALAWFGAAPMLRWLNTPDDVMFEAVRYFQFYYIGALGMALYNCGTGILRSVGDSVRPLIYLVITSVINVILDYVFVGWMHLGVGSVALATSLAQTISAILCMGRLAKYDTPYKLYLGQIKIHNALVSPIVKLSVPAGIQNAMTAISNILIASCINLFGSAVIAGSGVWFRLQGLMLMPVSAMIMVLSTYVAQNDGAKAYDRIIKGARIGVGICIGLGLLGTAILLPFCGFFSSFFSSDPLVIENAVLNAKVMAPLMVLLAITHGISGTLQGAGKVKYTMWTFILTWCVGRVIICKGVVALYPRIELVYLAYPITWIMSASVFLYFYIKVMKSYKEKQAAKEI